MTSVSFSSFLTKCVAADSQAQRRQPRTGWRQRWAAALGVLALAGTLSACGSVGVGIGVPLGPLSVGVGLGSGGVSAGVGTGIGPVGVGVGVNQHGQVTGQAGVGASTSVGGGARVGASVGTGTVLYDPAAANSGTGSRTTAPVPPGNPPRAPVQWYGPHGPVPACQVQGVCP